uniref:SDG942 n=1 Tax=Arundo donax TaxID=35708 RepID=A0A0A9GYJ8_ARUDO
MPCPGRRARLAAPRRWTKYRSEPPPSGTSRRRRAPCRPIPSTPPSSRRNRRRQGAPLFRWPPPWR